MTTTTNLKAGVCLDVRFPSLNKNDTLSRNDKEIADRSNVSRCRIRHVIELDLGDWSEVAGSLLDDCALWGKIGGQELSDLDREAFRVLCREHDANADDWKTWIGQPVLLDWFRTHSFTEVVAVTCQGQEPFFVNTEGYSYARYVGRAA